VVGGLKYFFDENLLPVAKAIAKVRSDIAYPGHPEITARIPRGAKDPDWLPMVGAADLDLVVVSHDKRIRTKPAEISAIRAHRVRCVVLTSTADLTSWDKLDFLVRRWDRMERHIKKCGVGPWIVAMTSGTFKDIPI
jgi:PIN like domain